MKQLKKFLLKLSWLFIGLCATNAQETLFVYEPSYDIALPQSLSNTIEISDMNNDNVNDIIISGYDSSRFGIFLDVIEGNLDGSISTLFESNIITFPDSIAQYVGGIGNIDLVDVNRDGMMDLYLNGSATSKLYINEGGILNLSNNWFPQINLSYSSGKWGDANMDGAPDLFLMGVNEFTNQIINELYLNKGSYLEIDPNTIFPSLINGSNAWGDYDNDGDQDLIICGRIADKTASITRFYKNDPIGRLTELTTFEDIPGLKAGAFKFVDLDSDGDQDLIMTGWNKIEGRLITRIMRNDPLGTYTPFENQINFAVAYGNIDAIDYNLDGYKDFVISGADSVSDYSGKIHSLSSKIFLNNNGNSFTELQEIQGTRVAKFIDINLDKIPDLIVNGTTKIGKDSSSFTKVFINNLDQTNNKPDPPSSLTAFAISTRAIFTWGSGLDDYDNPINLSYNLRIGTTSGGNQLMSSSTNFNNSNAGQRLIREFNEIPHGTYYWAVQTVDGSGQKSVWSQEDTLFISRLVTSTQSLPGVYYSSAGWADYNNDDFLDLALTGVTFSGPSVTNLYKSTDGLLYQDLGQDMNSFFGGHVSWVDYTNDGNLDLTLTGFQISDYFGGRGTGFYKWENGVFVEDLESEINLDNNNDGLSDYWINGGVNGHHWGDYDNDGDLDYVQAGWDNYLQRHLDIFYNDRGILRLDTHQTNLVPIYPGIVQWVNLNGDDYLDLVTVGSDQNEELGLRVYLNNSNYILSKGLTWDSNLFGVTAGAAAFADYNSDGYDDFALTGLNRNNQTITYILTNSINRFEVKNGHVLQGVFFGKPAWGDYDSDGDLDLIITGQSNRDPSLGLGVDPITIIYNQQSDGSFEIDNTLSLDSVGVSFTQWGDYDLDGDLDLFIAGQKENGDVISKVYDNLEGIENPNLPPNPPYGLNDDSIDDNQVLLQWNRPIDPDIFGATSEQSLRFQIQIGSDEQNNEHGISSGKYDISEIGTTNLNRKLVQNLSEGNYSWRVRAIDNGLSTSNWSNTEYFYIDVTPPVLDTIRANYVSDDQVILIIKFKEDFYLNLNLDPEVFVTHPSQPDLDKDNKIDSIFVEKQSFNGDEWAGVLNLPDNYSGKAIQINISNVEDERQNKFEKTSIFKTPESIISQFGGTAISEDGSATLLLPQNAVEGDVSLKLLGQNISPDSNKIEFPDGSIILISDLYDIKPFDLTLLKPGILRIALRDTATADTLDTLGTLIPFIGRISNGEIYNMGGSQLKINNDPYVQVQIDSLGIYGVFVSQIMLEYDSLRIDSLICQPRVFSPGGSGSVFEFTETNILYDLEEPSDNVVVRIFNLSGRLKKTLKPQNVLQSGHQIINWNGKDYNNEIVPSGLYIVTLEKEDTILRTTVGVLNR